MRLTCCAVGGVTLCALATGLKQVSEGSALIATQNTPSASPGYMPVAVLCPLNSYGTDVPSNCTCNAGFSGTILQSDVSPYYTGTCLPNQCTCANGVASNGSECPTDGATICTGCDQGYALNAATGACEEISCSCANGVAATGVSCPAAGMAKCTGCNDGHVLSGDECSAAPVETFLDFEPTNTNCNIGCNPGECSCCSFEDPQGRSYTTRQKNCLGDTWPSWYATTGGDAVHASSSQGFPHYVSFEMPVSVLAASYRVSLRNLGDHDKSGRPRDWTFSGSEDGTKWVQLDEVAGYDWTTVDYEQAVSSSKAFKYFKFDMTARLGGGGHYIIWKELVITGQGV